MRQLPFLLVALSAVPNPVGAAEPLPLKDGDRVVFLGSTVIEREQKNGYWETALTIREPQKNIAFRNLGWSGDTVWGESRCSFDFDKPGEGVRRIVQQVLAVKPTVIVLGYGANESFAGEAGLPRFRDGLNALVDKLAPTKARIAFLAPFPLEKSPPPLPEPAEANRRLDRYRESIREIALQRGCEYLDLMELVRQPLFRWTQRSLSDNGLHLTAHGYWRTGQAFLTGRPLDRFWKGLELGGIGESRKLTAAALPLPRPPGPDRSVYLGPFARRVEAKQKLPAGDLTLVIDGRPSMTTQADTWEAGVALIAGPDLDQVENLRQAIVEKNQHFFHRWRPQNETYLFGFRKHEQGQNAREIPDFDPLIAEREKEISRLRVPVPHTYELVPEEKVKK